MKDLNISVLKISCMSASGEILSQQRTSIHIDRAVSDSMPGILTVDLLGLAKFLKGLNEGNPVKPEDLTGPFFTVSCDVKRVELVIKKLVDIAIFLASTETAAKIDFTVERDKKEAIIVKLIGSSPRLTQNEIEDILVPYYGRLSDKTNLKMGSGLEGFLVKQITDKLQFPLNVTHNESAQQTIFTLRIPKRQ